ncbi:hypothetical protein HUG10_19615 (plasmid) [Halorarum halophilum]|uniref:Uncharacterized protein n=1 Tax=Halorarum halophilum TaxID=2743090 RepID=A0A7D5KPT5_9EURY|nr:hypothetical protein HUG10_19615 [Halobaculum halophilum]
MMEDGELSNRVESFAARFVNEGSLLGDCRHHTVVDELTDQLLRNWFVDVRRRNPGCVPVLCEEVSFEPLMIVCRVLEDVWTSHRTHAPARLQARLAHSGVDKPLLLSPRGDSSVVSPAVPASVPALSSTRGCEETVHGSGAFSRTSSAHSCQTALANLAVHGVKETAARDRIEAFLLEGSLYEVEEKLQILPRSYE